MPYVILNKHNEFWSKKSSAWTKNFNEATLFIKKIEDYPIKGTFKSVEDMRALYEHPDFYPVKDAIDRAFDMLMAELQTHNVPAATDDRAEKLINHITEYVVESGYRGD